MPYQSNAQRRWAHTATGIKALSGKDKVREWDNASRGKKLPERVKKSVEQQAQENALAAFGIGQQKEAVSAKWILDRLDNKPKNDPKRVAKSWGKFLDKAKNYQAKGEHPNIHHFKSYIAAKGLMENTRKDNGKNLLNKHYLQRLYRENKDKFPTKVFDVTQTGELTKPVPNTPQFKFKPPPLKPIKINLPSPPTDHLFPQSNTTPRDMALALGLIGSAMGGVALYDHFHNKKSKKKKAPSLNQSTKNPMSTKPVKLAVEQQARADALAVFGIAKQAVSDDWILKKIRNHAQSLINNPDPQAAQRASQRAANISEQITNRATRQSLKALPDIGKAIPPSSAAGTVAQGMSQSAKGLSGKHLAMGLGALGLAGAGYGLHHLLSRPKPQDPVSKQACLDAFRMFGLTE